MVGSVRPPLGVDGGRSLLGVGGGCLLLGGGRFLLGVGGGCLLLGGGGRSLLGVGGGCLLLGDGRSLLGVGGGRLLLVIVGDDVLSFAIHNDLMAVLQTAFLYSLSIFTRCQSRGQLHL